MTLEVDTVQTTWQPNITKDWMILIAFNSHIQDISVVYTKFNLDGS